MSAEPGSDRICVRPSLARLLVASLIYTALLVAVAYMIDQYVFGGMFTPIGIEVAAIVLGLWVPLQALLVWWLCSFEVDGSGLHQNHLFAQLMRVLWHLPPDKSISWRDRVWLMTHTRGVISLCWQLPPGGVLSIIRNLSKSTFIILPWRWLIADLDGLQAILERHAPRGHPLRRFYGLPSVDGAVRTHELS